MRIRIFAIALVVLALATIAFAADDPFVGTWKLNVAKSQNGMIITPWKSGTVKIEAQDGGHKYTGDFYYETQPTLHTEYAAKYDGKDNPTTGSGGSYFDAVSLKKIDANTLEFAWKLGGKETSRWQFVLSKDSKTATVTMKYSGQFTANQVMFLERQ